MRVCRLCGRVFRNEEVAIIGEDIACCRELTPCVSEQARKLLRLEELRREALRQLRGEVSGREIPTASIVAQ